MPFPKTPAAPRGFAAIALFCLALTTFAQVPATPLFATSVQDLDGHSMTLARYKCKPLVVNFWARWCAPCRQEIPALSQLRASHQGRLDVLGLGIENDPALVRQFAQAQAMDYPVFLAGEQGMSLMEALGNRQGGLPFTIAINRRGEVVWKKLGLVKKTDLELAAEKALHP